MNIDDLPEFELVEILCRLSPENAVRCKCVSKRWCSLISDPNFVRHYVCVQIDNQKPVPRTLIFLNTKHHKREFFSLSSKPDHDLLFKTPRDFTLSFVPCFQAGHSVDKLKLYHQEGISVDKLKLFHLGEPVVIGAYNDLVMCCATTFFQRDYYICNPYTKQCEALPPTPSCYKRATVGFICDIPYYKEDDDQKQNGTSSSINIIQLNINDVGYRYKVVRIIDTQQQYLRHTSVQFNLEIFSIFRDWYMDTVSYIKPAELLY